jgi:hypothetical protein
VVEIPSFFSKDNCPFSPQKAIDGFERGELCLLRGRRRRKAAPTITREGALPLAKIFQGEKAFVRKFLAVIALTLRDRLVTFPQDVNFFQN